MAAIFGSAGSALAADITGTVTTPQNTTDSIVDIHDANINVNTSYSEEAAIMVDSATTATVTIRDVTASSTGTSWTEASPYSIKGAQGVSVTLGGTNAITLVSAQAGGSGLIASTETGGGGVFIGITGILNVSNYSAGWYPDVNDGLKATATNGSATVIHSGTGKIQTVGGNAITSFVSGNAVQGDAVVTLQGAGGKDTIELETAGSLTYSASKGNHGISASIEDTGNTTGQVLITTDAKITTSGGYADAIRAQAQGGTVDVKNAGTLQVSGDSAIGIHALNGNGLIYITNSGDITATGGDSKGIRAASDGGDIYITNSGDITATSQGGTGEGTGILADSRGSVIITDGTETGTVVVLDQGGNTITTSNRGIHATGGDVTVKSNSDIVLQYTGSNVPSIVGIEAVAGNSAGDTYVEYDGSGGGGISVSSNATNASSYMMGIFASNAGASGDPNSTGSSVVVASGDVAMTQVGGSHTNFIYGIEANTYGTGDATIHYQSGSIRLELENGSTVDWGHGLVVQGFGTGSAYIQTDSGTAISTIGDNVTGMHLSGKGTVSGSSVVWGHIDSVIDTNGASAHGIWASADNAAMIELTNLGAITTQGTGANGIYAINRGNGQSTVINSGIIEIRGDHSYGLYVEATHGTAAGSVQVANMGSLNVADGTGIYAGSNSGDVTVTNAGSIIATQGNAATLNHGIDVQSLTGTATVVHGQGTIKVSGNASSGGDSTGIVAGDGNSGSADQQSYIYLGSGAVVDAGSGVGALQIRTNGYGEVSIARGAQVFGGSGYGVQTTGTGTYVINNAGEISSVNERAIFAEGQVGSTLTVNNYGTVTGYLQSAATQVTFNNYSSESLNLRNYHDSNGDGVADTKAVSVSTFGGGTFNNAATGTVRLLPVSGENLTDTTGEYVSAGALSTATPGIVQAQLLDLTAFNNAGTIDLTTNNQAGDVLVISGGSSAGSYGAGQYISNGGVLKLNTYLGYGSLSYSDVLVVDDVVSGAGGATRIHVNPTLDSTGGLTAGDGIKLVEVQGSSDANTFVLAAPVTYGAYEYVLGTGLSSGNEQSWYLRNTDSRGKAIMSPNAGAYLGNQYAAASMFNHNILDRRESIRNANSNVWIRLSNSDSDTRLFGGRQKAEIQTTVVQIGADLFNKDNYIAGIYGGYGHSQIDNDSRQTTSSASGNVDGYHLGAYVSWLPDEHVGPYVDAWGYYAWFDNKLQGAGQTRHHDYDSTGYALSLEGGYGFELAAKEDGSAWILKPHAQIIYAHVNADDFTDQNYTYYSGAKTSGIQTRLGARLYGRMAPGERGVTPFIETNWLHNTTDNAINMNGVKAESDIGKNIAELKLGVQGQINEGLSVWGHIGGQKGNGHYHRYEVQLGIGYRWK